jgi:GMP synthase-like glutamine amidotransferase
MKIHILQHVAFETPGVIVDWAEENNHTLSYTFLFENNLAYPEPAEIDILIIMGGPMGVYEEAVLPWMKAEKEFIKLYIAADKIVLGICLGAQLLAEALGAKVYPHHTKEIGFFPALKTMSAEKDELFRHLPEEWPVFHWHGDTFDLPEGATLLFKTDVCKNQAYRKGKCIGLQFHPEVNEKLLLSMVENEKYELVKAEYIQTEEEILQQIHLTADSRKLFFELLNNISKLN